MVSEPILERFRLKIEQSYLGSIFRALESFLDFYTLL